MAARPAPPLGGRRAHPRASRRRHRRPRPLANRSRSNGSSGSAPARTKSRSRSKRPWSPRSTTRQDAIELVLTVVDNTEASDTLATRIAAGDSPDIIGPIGIRGLQSFGDQLLDIGPLIASSGVDLSEIDPALIDVYNVDGKQIGIPMAVYSSFIYYNKSLFDEAGLA